VICDAPVVEGDHGSDRGREQIDLAVKRTAEELNHESERA
jgi:hypothetical protein